MTGIGTRMGTGTGIEVRTGAGMTTRTGSAVEAGESPGTYEVIIKMGRKTGEAG